MLSPSSGAGARSLRVRLAGTLGHLCLALLLAAALQVPYMGSAPPVEAHCSGGAVPDYEWATETQDVVNRGARVYIGWANPAVCALNNGTGFTSEWITTCDWECSLGRDGWFQVGWVKRTGWANPKGYCELAASQGGTGFGGGTTIIEFALAAGTYQYNVREASSSWWCTVDGLTRASRTTAWAAFPGGT
jgi:hypothetical protein